MAQVLLAHALANSYPDKTASIYGPKVHFKKGKEN
jgi:hypothetical protein